MSFSLIAFIKAIILPPSINFILITFGLILIKKNKILSRFLIYTGAFSLLLFSFAPFSYFLMKKLEVYPALEPPLIVNGQQAIVVLAGGTRGYAGEYGREVDTSSTLQRNHYAAFLYKQTGLPILVSGDSLQFSVSDAEVMARTLKESFAIDVKWKESSSRNTAENAVYSTEILKANNINSIFLVTHAWHMPRSVMIFEKQGIKVTPAPTIFVNQDKTYPLHHYLPSAGSLLNTRIALHEYLGMLWYKLRY